MAISCSSEKPPEMVMGEEEMINYLIDLHLAEASIQNIRLQSDSAKIVFAAKEKFLFKTHNITDSIFVLSYNYYLQRPIKLEEIYGAVIDSISLRQSLLKEE